MAVFPKEMDRMGDDPQRNISVLDAYIRYMAERIEFSMAGMGRTVSGAGVASAGLALDLKEIQNSVGALASAVGLLTGEVNGMKSGLGALNTTVSGLSAAVEGLNQRVTALENAGNGK